MRNKIIKLWIAVVVEGKGVKEGRKEGRKVEKPDASKVYTLLEISTQQHL